MKQLIWLDIILQDITDKNLTRADIALTYLHCLESNEDIDYQRSNKAITNRWGVSALKQIKQKAWEDGKNKWK